MLLRTIAVPQTVAVHATVSSVDGRGMCLTLLHVLSQDFAAPSVLKRPRNHVKGFRRL